MPDSVSEVFGLIVLAAGASTRLQSPKQLLPYCNSTLLQHTVNAAAASWADPVIVILGANAEIIESNLEASQAHIVHNTNWMEGMSSSIRIGLRALTSLSPMVDGVIFTVCDQPFVTADLLNDMISLKQQGNNSIIACSYADTIGTPVLFGRRYFPELLSLKGEGGARTILNKYRADLTTVDFAAGEIDIDTKDDYALLFEKVD